VDGPFGWTASGTRAIGDQVWRRTDRGMVPAGVPHARVEWIRAEGGPGPWPRCLRVASEWECWGIAATDAAVVTISAAGRVWWASALPLVGAWRSAAWGRIVSVRDADPVPSDVRITFAHPVAPSSGRFAGIRLDTALVADAGAVSLRAGVAWVYGEMIPPKAWMEVRSSTGGPGYFPLDEVATGGVSVPLEIRLSDSRTIGGVVTGTGAQPAPGTLLTLFRLIDPPPPRGSTIKPRRVFAAETTSDENGAFAIAGRGEAAYEMVVWHPQLGRTSLVLDDSRDLVNIRLDAAPLVRGRVMSGGHPVGGVDVVSVPDAETLTQTRDVTEVKGGDAKTGKDGRFAVALATAGGGELRIGGGAYAVRRVPLPRSATSGIELGDVELEAPIELVVSVDRDPGCTLQMVGPLGRMGLQIVNGVRDPSGHRIALPEAGMWQAGLVCPAGRRLLLPESIQITRAMAGTVVQVSVR
jgi:hypothetical protein